MIHPTAFVSPTAKIGSHCVIGPYVVIDGGVSLGSGCKVGPHSHLTGDTVIGSDNEFHAGCVIGDEPQDVKYDGAPTRLRIGDNNIFREHVTIHRSNKLSEDTVIGSNNFLMAHTHVGHNSVLGNHIIMANGALIGGHATIADRVFISGNCLVHQFVRIGRYALMQGGSAITKDLPTGMISRGFNGVCGLNAVGMRRAGVPAASRSALKRLYHQIYRSGLNIRAAVALAKESFTDDLARETIEFIEQSKRGIVSETRRGHAAVEQEE